jgi:hypothetical protein
MGPAVGTRRRGPSSSQRRWPSGNVVALAADADDQPLVS